MPKYRVVRGKIGRVEDGGLKQYGPGLADTDPETGKEVDMSIIEMSKEEAARYMSQLEEMPGQYDPVTANVAVEEKPEPVGAKVETGQLEPVSRKASDVKTTTTTPTTSTTSTTTTGAWNGNLSTLSDTNVSDVTSYLEGVKDPATVQKVVDAEKEGRNRKGIIAAGEDKLSSFK